MQESISVVWSSFGHTFMGDGNGTDEWGDWTERCMSCGATYYLTRDLQRDPDGSYGKYQATNGDDPRACVGSVPGIVHGYERVCQHDNGRQCASNIETGKCGHVDHDCNCVQCA